jgi:hypothetical protein
MFTGVHSRVRRVSYQSKHPIDHEVDMTAEAVHVAQGLRHAPVRHRDRHLMQRLGQKRPEGPVMVGGA